MKKWGSSFIKRRRDPPANNWNDEDESESSEEGIGDQEEEEVERSENGTRAMVPPSSTLPPVPPLSSSVDHDWSNLWKKQDATGDAPSSRKYPFVPEMALPPTDSILTKRSRRVKPTGAELRIHALRSVSQKNLQKSPGSITSAVARKPTSAKTLDSDESEEHGQTSTPSTIHTAVKSTTKQSLQSSREQGGVCRNNNGDKIHPAAKQMQKMVESVQKKDKSSLIDDDVEEEDGNTNNHPRNLATLAAASQRMTIPIDSQQPPQSPPAWGRKVHTSASLEDAVPDPCEVAFAEGSVAVPMPTSSTTEFHQVDLMHRVPSPIPCDDDGSSFLHRQRMLMREESMGGGVPPLPPQPRHPSLIAANEHASQADPSATGQDPSFSIDSVLRESPAHQQENATDEDLLREGIRESEKEQQENTLTKRDIETFKDDVRILRNLVTDSFADLSALEQLLLLCRTNQKRVTNAIYYATNLHPIPASTKPSQADSGAFDTVNDIDMLIQLNTDILEAIMEGENAANDHRKPPPIDTSTAMTTRNTANTSVTDANIVDIDDNNNNSKYSSSPTITVKSSRSNANNRNNDGGDKNKMKLDVAELVNKRDIFSLICMLRVHQNEARLDAAMALMRFGRAAEYENCEVDKKEAMRLRDEIRSSGGLHSLLTLFRTRGISHELKVVTALAVAYLLPSFVDFSSETQTSPGLGLKIIESLTFLICAKPVVNDGENLNAEEMLQASIMALTSFWVSHLEPMFTYKTANQANASDVLDIYSLLDRQRSHGITENLVLDQRRDSAALDELLERTVSLVVHIAKYENELAVKSSPHREMGDVHPSTLVEQVCALDFARPIAVREGILHILVNWIGSNDREKIRSSVSSLLYLTSVSDKYLAGWIHSEMVNNRAVQGLADLTRDISVTYDVRLAIAKILSFLCAAPHTRAAVAEAKCIYFLIGILHDYSDPATEEAVSVAGIAIVQLAAGAITRVSSSTRDDLKESPITTAIGVHKLDSVIE
jgi:hypothetical protein